MFTVGDALGEEAGAAGAAGSAAGEAGAEDGWGELDLDELAPSPGAAGSSNRAGAAGASGAAGAGIKDYSIPPPVGTSIEERWVDSSPVAADHIAAGSFSTAMQVYCSSLCPTPSSRHSCMYLVSIRFSIALLVW